MKLFFSRIGVGMLFSVLCGIIMPHTALGQQENFTLTITPPLFQLTIGPGEFWTSSVKIVNANAYDITVYASAVDFKQYGEEGQEMFMPLFERKAGEPSHALASWLELPSDGTFIKKGESRVIPFSLRIPADADPGSHYAAILVGTRPLKEPQNESVIKVSSMVSSLLFARIKGDIRESGFIREFSAGMGQSRRRRFLSVVWAVQGDCYACLWRRCPPKRFCDNVFLGGADTAYRKHCVDDLHRFLAGVVDDQKARTIRIGAGDGGAHCATHESADALGTYRACRRDHPASRVPYYGRERCVFPMGSRRSCVARSHREDA